MKRPEKLEAERILGLDLSKKSFVGCVLSKKDGYTKHKMISGEMDPEGRMLFIRSLRKGDLVAIEGGTSSSNFAREMVKGSEADVYILNPFKLHQKIGSSCKTDTRDAVHIARYIRDTHPESWCLIPIPSDEESEARTLITAEVAIKKDMTRHTNLLHSVFTQNGYPMLTKGDLKNPFSRERWVEELLSGRPAAYTYANTILESLREDDARFEVVEQLIREQILLAHPDLALPWLSLPGVGPLTAAACIAFIWDGERFSSASQIRNYVGLIPRVYQSGEVDNRGGVVKAGCIPVRRNIVQSSFAAVRLTYKNGITDRWHEQLAMGKKIQKVAISVANHMLTVGLAMLKRVELYHGVENYSYLKRKLRNYKLTAIDVSLFPELIDD